MLKTDQISKYFHKEAVLKEITLQCNKGEILGVIGSHHAGKSTLLRILSNVIQPDEGEITYEDTPFSKHLTKSIGFLPEFRMLYQKSKVLPFLKYFASLHGLSKNDAEIEAVRFLDRFNLIQYSQTPIEHLTQSDMQKLELIATFIHNPEIVVLDEPFKGLDFNNQLILKSLLFSMKRMGKTIILSSHNIDLIQQVSDNVFLLSDGKEILYGATEKILDDYSEDCVHLTYQDTDHVTKYFGDLPEVRDFYRENNCTTAYLHEGVSKQAFLAKVNQIILIERYEISKPSLRDIVLKIIPQDHFESSPHE